MIKFYLIIIFFCLCNSCFAISHPVTAKHDMVVSEHYLASQVGANVLQQGGNAIDAAIAIGYALAVVQPCCGNLGGGGFMTIHLANGKNIFINFREKAPFAATPTMFLDNEGHIKPNYNIGYKAVAVPGTVLGFETVLQRYGTFTRQRLMEPAIKLARAGFILTTYDADLLGKFANAFQKQPNVAAIFLKNNQPYHAGDRLIQKDLANTLQLISHQGAEVFYRGAIANTIVKSSKQYGGLLSLKDFAKYNVQILSPLQCLYHSNVVISAPPPSSGGVTLCEMLNILEPYPFRKWGFHSPLSAHYIIESMRYAFEDRNNKLGDPDFVHNPIHQLLSKEYAVQIRKKILPNKAPPHSKINEEAIPNISIFTTHYSVIDKWGNAVAVTYTLNSYFGAQVIAGNTGFFLNNEMDDFTLKPGGTNQFGLVQGKANNIEPGKRPLSSMTPTIVLKNKYPLLVLGSPGGPRIITSVLQVILNTLDYQMTIQEAVDAPRFHQQWLPDVVDTEPNTFTSATETALAAMGYQFIKRDRWGAVESIYIDPLTHTLFGANDNRRSAGEAIGH